MLSTDVAGFEIEEHGLHQGVPFPVYPFKTLVASSTIHQPQTCPWPQQACCCWGKDEDIHCFNNRMGMRRDFIGELKYLMFERQGDGDEDEIKRILGWGPNIGVTDCQYSVAKDKHLSDALCKIRFCIRGALTPHDPAELEVNKRNVVYFQLVVHYLISWFVSIGDAQVIEMIHYICWFVHYLISLIVLSGLLLH
jgi:hypothetical protein